MNPKNNKDPFPENHWHPMLHWIGKIALRITGWRLTGTAPPDPKFVAVCGPHTSNWDLPVFMMLAFAVNIRGKWLAKHTLFRWPLGWLFRRLGGIAVDRRAAHNVVHQVVNEFNRHKAMVLGIAPEGTRRFTDHWKSGFYQIALAANVPILLGYADFARKEGGVADIFLPSGDLEADLQRIRQAFEKVTPKRPENRSLIRFKETPSEKDKS